MGEKAILYFRGAAPLGKEGWGEPGNPAGLGKRGAKAGRKEGGGGGKKGRKAGGKEEEGMGKEKPKAGVWDSRG